MYRSTDGGANWLSTNMTNKYLYGIAVHPTTPSTILAAGMSYTGTKWGIAFFKSTDSGVNWTTTVMDTSGSANYGYCLAVDRSNPNTIYVGGFSYTSSYIPRAYKSTNGGANWVDVSTDTVFQNAYYVNALAVHPTNSNIVYAGTYLKGIMRSTNGGNSWTRVSSNYYNYSMATSIASPDIAYSGCYGEVYKTTNAGANWISVSSGLTGTYIYGLAVSAQNASNVYAGNNKGMFKTTTGGTSWTSINNNLNMGAILSFANAPSSPTTIYTSFAEVGIYKTTNSGTNWTQLPIPISCGNICEFAVAYNNPNLLYVLEGSG